MKASSSKYIENEFSRLFFDASVPRFQFFRTRATLRKRSSIRQYVQMSWELRISSGLFIEMSISIVNYLPLGKVFSHLISRSAPADITYGFSTLLILQFEA